MDPKTQAVAAFQKKIGAPTGLSLLERLVDGPGRLAGDDWIHDAELKSMQLLAFVAQTMGALDGKLKESYRDYIKDERVMRVHLVLSELEELVEGLLMRDEVRTLDALADLMYVVLGTATTFDLPVDQAFREVHAANMTKDDRNEHASDVKGKGANYKPPRIREILEAYRRDKL